jgi:hypothetical protein
MRLRPFWLSVIFVALAGCGSEEPSEQPELYVNRASLDFGQEVKTNVYVGQEVTESFYIENKGLQPLELTAVTKSGPGQFTLTLPEPLEAGEPMRLEYGERAFIQLGFKPTEAKKYEGKLLIQSNATNAPEKEVTFSGIGVSR